MDDFETGPAFSKASIFLIKIPSNSHQIQYGWVLKGWHLQRWMTLRMKPHFSNAAILPILTPIYTELSVLRSTLLLDPMLDTTTWRYLHLCHGHYYERPDVALLVCKTQRFSISHASLVCTNTLLSDLRINHHLNCTFAVAFIFPYQHGVYI